MFMYIMSCVYRSCRLYAGHVRYAALSYIWGVISCVCRSRCLYVGHVMYIWVISCVCRSCHVYMQVISCTCRSCCLYVGHVVYGRRVVDLYVMYYVCSPYH